MDSTARRVLRHPLTIATVAATALIGVGLLVAPEPLVALKDQRESGLEHISHGVLLLGVLLWSVVVARTKRDGPQVLGIVTLGYQLLLLLEETDWGQVYGVDLGVEALHHNTVHPATMFHDRLFLFALPGVAWALAPLVRRSSWSVAPRPEDGVVFLGILATYVASDMVIEGLHDVYQTLAYAVFLGVGLRALRAFSEDPVTP